MESIKTINLPEKASDNKYLLKKGSIRKKITKKLKQKSPYFLSVIIMILLYKRWNFKRL